MEETTQCGLKIEVIDETAVIETTPVCEDSEGNGVDINNVLRQETDGKKEKRNRRRGKGARKFSKLNLSAERTYTREEMEALRFVNLEAQQKKWVEVYCGLGPNVVRDYDGLIDSNNENHIQVNFDPRQQFGKKGKKIHGVLEDRRVKISNPTLHGGCKRKREPSENLCALKNGINEQEINFICKTPEISLVGSYANSRSNCVYCLHTICGRIVQSRCEDLSCSQVMDDEIDNINPLDPACDLGVGVEEECIEEDDSDEDYSSIQRPAFFVTGEPNFDAGPPQDGLEYLRRVRWEAAHVPKVKVAKLERSKLKKEQTAYMPIIPDIEKCPEHLLPMKQWEDAFMADFSELRLALSHLEDSRAEISAQYPFSSTIHPEESSNQLPETIIAENFDKLTNGGDESSEALDCSTPESPDYPRPVLSVNENGSSPSLENDSSKASVCGSSSDSPTLSAVLGMDSVARLSSLRRRIRLAENMTTLSRNDCAWLFALCAAIDTPLDADTCAALRCLLRKCSSLRAGKLELDDEVVILNILATITGKYFGQSEL
ncbi:hypothetical protein RHMOL_Rhmol09G0040100 [Rhododendron molle]|uniref:Uncharacterized protein n=1 Tax=Rhododendron molle TaxID=49168 RepID=A0ACC0MAW8_RHOML|nr:hypothetical protein RHMOL_Rhmol09G0040100 [Rhododendron molle]